MVLMILENPFCGEFWSFRWNQAVTFIFLKINWKSGGPAQKKEFVPACKSSHSGEPSLRHVIVVEG
jgi:hypothetical protein